MSFSTEEDAAEDKGGTGGEETELVDVSADADTPAEGDDIIEIDSPWAGLSQAEAERDTDRAVSHRKVARLDGRQ